MFDLLTIVFAACVTFGVIYSMVGDPHGRRE
jgi:hypothetical protein